LAVVVIDVMVPIVGATSLVAVLLPIHAAG
jgi:hypothetical protein